MQSIEEGVAGLVVEGRAAGTPTPDASPPAMPSANAGDGEAPEEVDSETPLAGIGRCGRHLRAATAALESLLAIEASLERGALAVGPSRTPSPTAVRNRPLGEEKEELPGTAMGRPKAAAATLGGLAGAFAFEAEMNLHLLGSSPHHHVHFRQGFEDGLRALLALARETERACGVVECEDLLDTRRYLLRFSQISAEVGGGLSYPFFFTKEIKNIPGTKCVSGEVSGRAPNAVFSPAKKYILLVIRSSRLVFSGRWHRWWRFQRRFVGGERAGGAGI